MKSIISVLMEITYFAGKKTQKCKESTMLARNFGLHFELKNKNNNNLAK